MRERRAAFTGAIDSKALLEAVEDGTVDAPTIAKNLERLEAAGWSRYSPS